VTKNEAMLQLGDRTETFQLRDKTFSTGSVGFYACGKIRASDGKRYQATIILVQIGTKPRD